MLQYLQQGVYLNTHKDELSEFKLDPTQLLKDGYMEDEIQNSLRLIQKNKNLPLVVSQQVLALHPRLKQLRTASLLTTFGNRYHVMYHNSNLGVHLQTDRTILPIGPSELYHEIIDEPKGDEGESFKKDNISTRPVNQTRNQLLWQGMSLAGQQPLVNTLLH